MAALKSGLFHLTVIVVVVTGAADRQAHGARAQDVWMAVGVVARLYFGPPSPFGRPARL